MIDNPREAEKAWGNTKIPLIVNPSLEVMSIIRPDVLVEATLSKKNTGTHIDDAPLMMDVWV